MLAAMTVSALPGLSGSENSLTKSLTENF